MERFNRAGKRSGAMKCPGLVHYAVLAVMLVTPLVHVACGSPPAPGPPPPPPFEFSIVPEEALCLPEEEVEITLSLTNVSSDPITLNPYPPEIQITPLLDHGQVLFSQAAGIQSQELMPEDTITVKFTWDQNDNEGQQVPPGWYRVTFRDVTFILDNDGGSTLFTTGARVLIQYPQGAMVKTIEPDDSQTANEVTITLERVEMSAAGVAFHALIIPRDYSPPAQPPPGVPPPPPSPAIDHVHAEYMVNGIAKSIGHSSVNYAEDDGITLILGGTPLYIDPVPSDAQTLTLRIAQIDDWEGPWEFEIPLD